MTIRNTMAAMLAFAVAPAVAGAAEITVWDHVNFRGASTVYDASTARLTDVGWNDRISSLRIDSGQWEICRDIEFRSCRVLGPGDELSALEGGWNDAISSLRPASGAAAAAPDDVAARLYVALLGRDADPEGLRNASAQIRAGRTASLVSGMTTSQEFRTLQNRLSSTELLDQIYRGLLGRRPDTAARTAYLGRLEDGDVAGVVLDLVGSEEFGPGGGGAVADTANDTRVDEVQARGSGVALFGGKKYFETANAARVQIGGNGRIRIVFTGSSQQSLDGTYTRESNDFLRVNAVEWPQRGTVPVSGGVTLDNNQLARVDVSAGAQGTRDRLVFAFVAEGYQLPREETLCQGEVRARLDQQGAGGQLAFLAPATSRLGSNRRELTGEVVILSQNKSATYRCEVDSRGAQVLDVTVAAQ
jgi:hypothetical protein